MNDFTNKNNLEKLNRDIELLKMNLIKKCSEIGYNNYIIREKNLEIKKLNGFINNLHIKKE